MAIQLHIANRIFRLPGRAAPKPVVFRDRGLVRQYSFRDADFLTVERLGPMQSLSPEGFLIIRNVPLARTGPQLYSDQEIPIKGGADGRIVIDRLPDEVFRPATIASLNGKAVTLDHPDDDVTPENYSTLAVGHVIDPRRGLNALDNLLLGDLVITNPEAIKAIRDKEVREVSVGYKADYEETGLGRGKQRNIICNHLALVRDGRCGPICRIGDKAFYPRHEADCGCDACSTHDEFKESEHPRDPGGSGRFGTGGGQSSSKEETSKPAGKGTHPGRGYSAEAELRDGTIYTGNVNDAVRALYEDRKVSLDQPHQVSTLVSKLSDIAKRMGRLGGKAPDFDLCNVSVAGTNLFCAETKGIPRAQMPQLGKEGPAFEKFLADKGFTSSADDVPVAHLKATQDELVGAKVSAIMRKLRDRDPSEDDPLFVSRDDYILDGHHRWAARVGLDAGGELGKTKIKVQRVDLGIIELLAEAETFTGGKGKKEAKAEARDRAFRDANEDEAADEAPEDEVPELDADLLEIAEGAPPSVMEALHAEQKRRNEGKPLPLLDPSPPPEPEDDTTWDHSLKTKRTGRFIHLHL